MTEDQTPEVLWKETKKVLLEAAKDTVGYMQQQKRLTRHLTWLTKKIMQRQKIHRGTKAEVRGTENAKKRQTEASGSYVWWAGICKCYTENVRKLNGAVRSVTRKFQPRLHFLESASGGLITETEKIAERWRAYCEDLYIEDQVQRSQPIRQYVK